MSSVKASASAMTAPSAHRQWLIADRPAGRPLRSSDFRLDSGDVMAPRNGELLVQTLYLGFNPAQKSWMETESGGYRGATALGAVMPGQGCGRVIESRAEGFAPGDLVIGEVGWAEYPTVRADQVRLLPAGISPEAALCVLDITGRTAFLALSRVGRPNPGDTLVISGAAGATGSLVGQIGKIAGCRVIGIAGGPEKCAHLTGALGFDAAIDYRSEKVRRRLRELCPNGVDIFFDNVGGPILDDALACLAFGGRVVICGAIARYDFDPRSDDIPAGPRNYFNVVFTAGRIEGFLLQHHERDFPIADARLVEWLRDGRIKATADVQVGFENAPEALGRLFAGLNRGKQVLRIAED